MNGYKSFLLTTCFPFFGFILVILSLVPINFSFEFGTAPDLLFCYMFAFLFRFPQNASLASMIIISLFADLLWFRPIGLTTFTTFLAFEFIRWIIKLRERIGPIEEFAYVTLILVP